MTIKELSQLFYLNREIDDCKKRLEELEEQRGVSAVVMDDMPRGSEPAKSRVEQLAAEIVDLQAIIHAKQIECLHERNRLERYIATIPDSVIRQIFEHRFVDGFSWGQVASCVGGDNTPDSVRMACNRYLQKVDG